MNFRFNINMTDKDYLEFNRFHLVKSRYGKKQVLRMRIFIAVFAVFISLVLMYVDGFSFESFKSAIPIVIFLIAVEVGLVKFTELVLKLQIKSMKKTGKMAYSPSAVMEFHNDVFVEYTDVNRTEQKYSVIESIAINKNGFIYIYVNNILAYILPFSSFESEKQYNDFIEFLEQKTSLKATF